jgi:hypothetical protein
MTNDIRKARAEGQAQAQICAENAATLTGFNVGAAQDDAEKFIARHGAAGVCGESVTDWLKTQGHRPHDDRAFGAVFGGLSRQKRIVCIGHTDRRKGHGTSGGKIWRIDPA